MTYTGSGLLKLVDWQSKKWVFDSVAASKILGHSDIKMTMRYAHPTPENKRKAVNVLAAVFGQKDSDSQIKVFFVLKQKEILNQEMLNRHVFI